MKRRRQGNGSLFLNGRTWWMQFYQNGERVRESTGSVDKMDAEKILARRLLEAAALTFRGVSPGAATIDDLAQLVFADHELKECKDQKEPRQRYAKHIARRWGKLKADRLTTADIRTYVKERRREGAKNATINRELEIVRRGFNLGKREEPPLVHDVPYIEKLPEKNARQGFIEQYQYEKLLEALPPELKALFVCAYHVGTRKGELRKIRWEWIDWDAGMIRVPGTVTKNSAPRTLPIYGDMMRWLEGQREKCPEGNPYVFFGRWRASSERRIGGENKFAVSPAMHGWDEACKAAGLEGLTPHDLRRSAVRNMKRAGIVDSVAMRITGHKTRSMYDRYDIVDETDLIDAGRKLAEYAAEQKKARAARLKLVKVAIK